MTKPFTPEFVTYDQADAYLKAARGGDGKSRPTKDAWNTRLVRVNDTEMQLTLQDEPLLTYRAGMTGALRYPMDFSARKRMNDYMLVPWGYRMDRHGNVIAANVHTVRGVGIPAVTGRFETGMLVDYTAAPILRGHRPLAVPLMLDSMVKDDIAAYAEKVPNLFPWTQDLSEAGCRECRNIVDERSVKPPHLGPYTGDREHMFVHLYGPSYDIGQFSEAWLARFFQTRYGPGARITLTLTEDPKELIKAFKSVTADRLHIR